MFEFTAFDFDISRFSVTYIEVCALIFITPPLTIWILSIAPRMIIGKVLKKVAAEHGEWNDIQRKERTTHADRNIVIPSPDFVYSVACVDMSDPSDSLHFKTSFSSVANGNLPKYSSLGVYDSGGLCIDIVSHPGAEVDVVVVSSSNGATDAAILLAMETKCGPAAPETPRRVVRLRTVTGVLLHRLLVEDPEQYEHFRRLQEHILCDRIALSGLAAVRPESAEDEDEVRNFRRRVGVFLLLALARPAIGMTPSQRGDAVLSLMFVLVTGVVTSAILAIAGLKLLRLPHVVSRLRFGEALFAGGWRFHTVLAAEPPSAAPAVVGILTGAASWARRVTHELVVFLHGALALLPSEVIYGVCMRDAAGAPLVYGGTYLIRAPCSDEGPRCLWWSVTLYGRDLFLIKHDDHAYGVNSMQLGEPGKESFILCSPEPPASLIKRLETARAAAGRPCEATELTATLRELTPDMPWIACPAEDVDVPGSQPLSPGPRLILRCEFDACCNPI